MYLLSFCILYALTHEINFIVIFFDFTRIVRILYLFV